MTYKLILFDADGTLFNDDEPIVRAFKKAFIKHGYRAPDAEVILKHAGLFGYEWAKAIAKDERILKNLTDEKIREIALDADHLFNSFFFKVLGKETHGTRVLLEHLKKQNINFAIVTNANAPMIIESLKIVKLNDLVHEKQIYAADKYQAKPNPEMLLAAMKDANTTIQETILVGDTQTDVDAANAAGINSYLLVNSRNKNVKGETQRITSLNQIISLTNP